MADGIHKYRVGQTVDLIPSASRFAAKGTYRIVSLRPTEGGDLQYRIKSQSEAYERIISESDLVLSANLKFN
jgi:hypothetical protein